MVNVVVVVALKVALEVMADTPLGVAGLIESLVCCVARPTSLSLHRF
jgi:hypothetical protein